LSGRYISTSIDPQHALEAGLEASGIRLVLIRAAKVDRKALSIIEHSARLGKTVVVLSEDHRADAAALALDRGASDFLPSAAPDKEILARVSAVVRRTFGHYSSLVKAAQIRVDLDAKRAWARESSIHLTSNEYSALEGLVLRAGCMVTREELLYHVYGDAPRNVRNIDFLVHCLRKKLCLAFDGAAPIETVGDLGYRIAAGGHRHAATSAVSPPAGATAGLL
jgi:DNA-binding response OmpR family regulator